MTPHDDAPENLGCVFALGFAVLCWIAVAGLVAWWVS